jgi:hypothetical protein
MRRGDRLQRSTHDDTPIYAWTIGSSADNKAKTGLERDRKGAAGTYNRGFRRDASSLRPFGPTGLGALLRETRPMMLTHTDSRVILEPVVREESVVLCTRNRGTTDSRVL